MRALTVALAMCSLEGRLYKGSIEENVDSRNYTLCLSTLCSEMNDAEAQVLQKSTFWIRPP